MAGSWGGKAGKAGLRVAVYMLVLALGFRMGAAQPPPSHPQGAPRPATTAYSPQTNPIAQEDSEVLKGILDALPKEFLPMVKEGNKYRLQIIFTQINRDAQNRPFLRHHTFGLDSTRYFHPASMVKLPTVALALERLNHLAFEDSISALNAHSPWEVRAGHACQSASGPADNSRGTGAFSVAHAIKKVLIVSDNVAYDHLFEFLGQSGINDTLRARGYASATVVDRYGHICSGEMNRHYNPMHWKLGDSIIYRLPARHDTVRYRHSIPNFPPNTSYIFSSGITLKHLHEIVLALAMPQTMPKNRRFRLTKADRRLLLRYMSMLPTESADPVFDPWYTATRMKYLLYGAGADTANPNIRVFNKVGLAGGFLTDCAYIVDFQTKTEFFLSVSAYTPTQDYPTAFKLFGALGKAVLKFEQTRARRYAPNLAEFMFLYDAY